MAGATPVWDIMVKHTNRYTVQIASTETQANVEKMAKDIVRQAEGGKLDSRVQLYDDAYVVKSQVVDPDAIP